MDKPAATFGPYHLLERVGAGSTSKVYRARRPGVAEVALKIFSPVANAEDPWLRRFQREAHLLHRLQHRNIVACLDFGEHDGKWFIAMELVRGHSLRSLVGGSPSTGTVARIGAQVASGLAAAHSLGLIHRDLKPENLMLTPDGIVKILDLGLARPVDQGNPALPRHLSSVTRTNMIVGTPCYMSPEQSVGAELTPATDIFCLGLCLFEAASGRHPFAADTPQRVLDNIRAAPTPPLSRWRPDLPPGLGDIVRVMLERDPGTRPSAEEAVQRFKRIISAKA